MSTNVTCHSMQSSLASLPPAVYSTVRCRTPIYVMIWQI